MAEVERFVFKIQAKTHFGWKINIHADQNTAPKLSYQTFIAELIVKTIKRLHISVIAQHISSNALLFLKL